MPARLLVGLSLVLVATGCGHRRESPTPKRVRVPDLIGLPETAAVDLLADAGLCLRKIRGTKQAGDSVVQLTRKLHTVVSQSLPPGSRVRRRKEIDLIAVRPGGADEVDTYIGCSKNGGWVAWEHRGSVSLKGQVSVSSSRTSP
jgi:PASTA domain